MAPLRLAVLGLALACASAFAPAVAPSRASKTRLAAGPTVYVYDHCPFCVRVRLALGLKGVRHDVRFMANDDVELPTSLVGKKIAPIIDGVASKPGPFYESMDIVKLVDADPEFGPVGAFKPATDRADIKAWQKSVQQTLRLLQRPRYMKTFLPEFAFAASRDTFVRNHQLPPYEKADWKSDQLTQDQRWEMYTAALDQTDELLDELNAKLLDLEPLICCPECCTEGGVSLDDIDLWSRLRSITVVKGVKFPKGVRAYLDHFAVAGDVPLYDACAV